MALSLEDQGDVRIQLALALVGAISQATRAIRVRVTSRGTLLIVGYFERVPLEYEREKLQDAAAEAAVSLFRVKLEPEVRCVVAEVPVLGLTGIDDFERREFGDADLSYWAYARHGEVPGDEDDHRDATPLATGEYTRIS